MPPGRQVFVKRDLQARHAGQICDFALQVCRRMAVARAVRGEEHDAVAGTSRRIVELPLAFGVEADEGLDPAWTVEIGPLIGEAQMRLDDAAANGLEVQHAGVALEMLPAPCTAPFFDSGLGFGADLPAVERPAAAGDPAGVAPPLWRAVDQGDIAADVLAFEQGRPHMTGLVGGGVVVGRSERAAADAHALQVVDRLGEHRVILRSDAVRCSIETLAHGDGKLVVNPAMRGIPEPGVAVLSGNENVCGTGGILEILSAPRVDLANRHLRPRVDERRLSQ